MSVEQKIQSMLERIDNEREIDRERWENLDWDTCQVCGSVGEDRRTLFIRCFYQLKEVSSLFIDLFHVENHKDGGYALRICKGCRSALLSKLAEWITEGGRLKYGNLDDDGILSFDSKEDFLKYKRRTS